MTEIREMGPQTHSRALRINPEILHQLMPVPVSQVELQTISTTQDRQSPTQIEQGQEAQRLGAAALRAGSYPEARRQYAQAIALLDGQVPDTQLLPLLGGQVSAMLGSRLPAELALPGAPLERMRAVLPLLQRIANISEANAQAVDRQHPANRPQAFMDLAFVQTALRDYETGAANYLRAIQMLEAVPGNNRHINTMLGTALNNYIHCLRNLPVTAARTLEINSRCQQLRTLQGG